MAEYTVWFLNQEYEKERLVKDWLRLSFWQKLNDLQPLEELALLPTDPLVEYIRAGLNCRIRILRDGVDVWGGWVEGIKWHEPQSAPEGSTYHITGIDHTAYAKYRICKVNRQSWPIAEFQSFEDCADNVAKQFVRYNLGTSANLGNASTDPDRQRLDLTIDGDADLCDTITENRDGDNLLTTLQQVAMQGSFYWRFIPSATGATFTTRYPLWGVDRSKGNADNKECVFSIDRRSFLDVQYEMNLSEHANYIYVYGEGDGSNRMVREVEGEANNALYGLREKRVDHRNYPFWDDCGLKGQRALLEFAPYESLRLELPTDQWKQKYDLGDKVSIRIRYSNRNFEIDPIIVAVHVAVDSDGIEKATPTLG